MSDETKDATSPAAVASTPLNDTVLPMSGLGNPADLEVPVAERASGQTATVRVSPPAPVARSGGKLPKGLIATYFAGGVALLLVGAVAVVYLAVRAYGGNAPESASVTVSRGAQPSVPAHGVSSQEATARKAQPPQKVPSSPVDPSDPARARFGPQRLANGKPFVIQGENNSKFQVTVTAGTFHKGACDIYSVKPEEGGYLPVKLKVKVLEGEPEISEYDFRFQKSDGSWLPSVGGSGCDGRDYGGFLRRLSAGREYSSSVVFDVPGKKGDIVFVYPIMDVVAAWKVG
ncbi:hypothetical protein [Actinoplanes sp. TFC3]|uniref:hypothetical protein n=1 Tax=Actinoplanes sp. TFC3 TaxID=1710355 RepID=UPI00082EB684|nr:hypothetical protein [Actinoplanes sp. TFC3]